MTLKEARAKLEAKQKDLADIFKQAKTEQGEYDFDKIKELGEGTTTEKLSKIHAMEKELDELYDECVNLSKAEGSWAKHQDRMKELTGTGDPDPANKGGLHSGLQERKSLGKQLVESKCYVDFTQHKQMGIVTTLDWGLQEIKNGMGAQMKALFETTAGWLPEVIRLPGFVDAVTRPIQLLDILPNGSTNQAAIKYMEETTRTHAAAERAEGGAFAESTFELTERSQPVEKITDSVPTTDEQLEDVAQAESYLTERLQFGLRQRLDSQALNGDGTSPNLKGILDHPIQTQAKGADPVPDAIFKAMTLVRFTGRAMPTHHILHPNDWQEIRLLRTADGIYIWGNPSEQGPERIWGLPVIQNDALAEGTGLVGSFLAPWIMLFDRRGIDVQIGFINDQFTKGTRTIRADMRASLVVFRPVAFCSVTGI
jgi:HK97 family phage major capsid protein